MIMPEKQVTSFLAHMRRYDLRHLADSEWLQNVQEGIEAFRDEHELPFNDQELLALYFDLRAGETGPLQEETPAADILSMPVDRWASPESPRAGA